MMERLLPLVNRKRSAAVQLEDNKVIPSLFFFSLEIEDVTNDYLTF